MWNIVRSSVIVAVVLLAGCAEQQQQPAPSAGYGYSSYTQLTREPENLRDR
jgi:hypothetical protein